MNKTYKLSALWMMCLMLLSCLSFTACNDGDEEDTNQYTGGIKLNVFGPSPVARGGELRFLGSGMNQVTGVVIPGCSEITDITIVSNEEIRVTVPQTSEPGYVTLKTPIGDIVTQTKLTYLEPISLESFSPTSIKAGATLTIKGEYLNLIQEVIFANNVTVPAADFVSQSRAEIKVVVPAEAQTGKIIISDTSSEDTEAIPNWIYSNAELAVVLPAIAEVADLSDKKPGDEITLTGSDLDLITKVVMPNGDEVEFTVDGDKLTFVLPENISNGSILVVPASGVEVVFATIGVALPSEVTADPATELRGGDKITLTGKNMELITNITFPGVADAVALDSQSETEVIVTMPEAAISGNLLLNTNSGTSVEVVIETQKPVFESFASDAVALASQVTIQGKNMDLVAKVTFTGGAEVTELTATETEVTLTMPSTQVETGVLTLTMANGETVETSALTINAPEACYIPELPGEDAELKGGEVFIITVENADKLTGVQVNGQDVDYLLNGNTLYINMPQTADANTIITLVSSNGQLDYAIAFIPATEIENVIMNEMHDLGSWTGEGDGGAFRLYKTDLINAGFAVGAKLRFYVSSYGYTQIQVNNANWGQYTMLEYNEGECPSVIELEVTQELYDQIMNTSDEWSDTGFVIQGQNCIISKVSVWYEISLETTIWEGPWTCSGWGGNQDLAWGGYDWSTVKAGATIRFYYNKIDESAWGCISLRHGNGWGNLPSPIAGQYDFDEASGAVEVQFTQEVLDDLIANGGLVLTGDNYILNKVTIE